MRSCTLPTIRLTRAKVLLGVTQSVVCPTGSKYIGIPPVIIKRPVMMMVLGGRNNLVIGFSKLYSTAGTNRSLLLLYDCPSLENAKGNRRLLTSSTTNSTTTTSTRTAQQHREEREKLQREAKRVLQLERLELLQEAASLTKSMYRICLRSVNLIRPGNEMDEKDFQKRHEEFRHPKGGMSSMSMSSRPPNREDELESRAAYYYSFCRESFLQESDCLEEDPLKWKNIQRFVYFLKKADQDRKWLLADMMFPDPYKTALSQERIQQFEDMARRHLGDEPSPSSKTNKTVTNQPQPFGSSSSLLETKEDSNDPFDDEVTEDPDWFQKKYPHLR
jgi:hypothetical protein